ncbi:MAG: DUF2188 domain-containing protein [Saprospiraceae bacterium]|nr:DUF2188 domain-containing protein [Saprospiraceae bacterium]
MAKITEAKFWTNLLKKLLNIVAKDAGVRTRPPTHHQHVVPHEEGWAVKGEGNERYTGIFDRQSQAIKRAKEIARNYGSDVIIHRSDGTIRDRISYDKED